MLYMLFDSSSGLPPQISGIGYLPSATVPCRVPFQMQYRYRVCPIHHLHAAKQSTRCQASSTLYITTNKNPRLPESFQTRFRFEFHIGLDGSVEDVVVVQGQKG